MIRERRHQGPGASPPAVGDHVIWDWWQKARAAEQDKADRRASPLGAPRPSVLGALAAAGACILGGTAVAATRFAVHWIDPLPLAFLRSFIGVACLLPLVVKTGRPRIARGDLLPVALLGVIFYGIFPWSFSAALEYTTASRGALVLSTAPLLTLFLSWLTGTEALNSSKLVGVTLAFLGVAVALTNEVAQVGGHGAHLRGELLMFAAALCGAVYNVFSPPYLRRYPRLSVTVCSMLAGTLALLVAVVLTGSPGRLLPVAPESWIVVVFLGVVGTAMTFFLLGWALELTSPTRVAVFVTLNPLVAISLGIALFGEPLTGRLAIGFGCVLAGIALVNQNTPDALTAATK